MAFKHDTRYLDGLELDKLYWRWINANNSYYSSRFKMRISKYNNVKYQFTLNVKAKKTKTTDLPPWIFVQDNLINGEQCNIWPTSLLVQSRSPHWRITQNCHNDQTRFQDITEAARSGQMALILT